MPENKKQMNKQTRSKNIFNGMQDDGTQEIKTVFFPT